ncbi:MAG TPA: hypothetical protein VGG06_30065 [Thermoanaerobaculia bacterium]|jgi:hypothetical protein
MKTSSVLFVLILGLATAAGAGSSATFDRIVQPYEEIRLLLLNDSNDGVAGHAARIRDAAQTAAAGTAETEEARKLLEPIAGFAGDLAAGGEIQAQRDAFYELSKLLVQYRAKVSGDDLPVVMYCPMVKRSWLQPAGEVGNPYHGQKMANCGYVVGE